MVRLLSVLPALMGTICILILGASLYGYSPPDSGMEVPIVPCPEGSSGCIVGMTSEDLSVPGAFILLDIRLSLEWAEPDRSWVAVVDAEAEKDCPPDANGLTPCTEEDIEGFIISGGGQNQMVVWNSDLSRGNTDSLLQEKRVLVWTLKLRPWGLQFN